MAPPTNADLEPGTANNEHARSDKRAAPEMKITLFAVRLAILEKTASGLATLAFIWATVVVLGGFATSIETTDFWFVTIVSLIEGTRIVRRSRELEWQYKITSNKSEVPLLPCIWGLFKAKNMGKWLLCVELLSGLTCGVLSLYRLPKQYYGVVSDSSTKNRKAALNIFYGLSLADALLYLLEKACWRFLEGILFPKVKLAYPFVDSETDEVYSLFYDTYSRCIKGSVLDGLGMDFVQYSADLLLSDDAKKQRRGAQVLSTIVKNEEFKEQTLRSIGAKKDVVEKLIVLLKCQDQNEKGTRKAAVGIVSDIVGITWIDHPVTAITSSIESIGTLLYDNESIEKHSSGYMYSDCSYFSLEGLKILKAIALQPIIKPIITELLPKIIGMTKLNPKGISIETVTHALELFNKIMQANLALTLQEMKKVDFCISNLLDVLQYRDASIRGSPILGIGDASIRGSLILAIDTLKTLAEAQDSITIGNANKGALANLFSVFLTVENDNVEETKELVARAGEALYLLSCENKDNCQLMMKTKLVHDHQTLMRRLISLLDDPLRGIVVAGILRNLCVYAEGNCVGLKEILEAEEKVVALVMKRDEQQASAIGLAAQIFRLRNEESSRFKHGHKESSSGTAISLISEILDVFRRHPSQSNQEIQHRKSSKISIRKFSIELLIAVIRRDEETLSSMSTEVRLSLERELSMIEPKYVDAYDTLGQ